MATIAAKLAASEREADAARVRAKLKAARLARMGRAGGNPVLPPPNTGSAATAEGEVSGGEPVKKDRERGETSRINGGEAGSGDLGREVEGRRTGPEDGEGRAGEEDVDAVDLVVVEKPRKRERRTGKATSRRRSTLDPWELQSLIQGDAGAVSAAEGS